MNSKWHTWVKILLIFSLLLIDGCSDKTPEASGDQKDFTPSILKENKMMQFFVESHPGLAVLKYAQADLDNDGKQDLIVIYQIAKDKNLMCVIRNRGQKFIETNSTPAPVSDQMIQFRNIDEKPPLEFILQGRKGAKAGYAIFRIEEDKLIDLFGEGMQDCC